MNFTSIPFYILFSTCIVLLLCTERFCKKDTALKKAVILVFASILYCGWQDWRFAVIVTAEAVFVYICALKIEATGKKTWIAVGVTAVLGCLGIFKYYDFFADTFRFFGLSVKRLELILPIGISFYSFSAIGYMTDVYRKKYPAEKNFLMVLLYMTFFPKLTAGPIITSDDFFAQAKRETKITLEQLTKGFQIILFGLIKKNVLSDHIAVFVDAVYGNVEMYNAPTLLLAVFGYGIQIYLDFSGYSDFAVGCSKCLGYDMPRNFNLPYLSRNVTEFWKRWHITLSDWLMRYLYISLGGNRKGYVRMMVNLILTMAIGGLWHGSSWNFVLWGLLHGIALCIHKQYLKIRGIGKDYVPAKPAFVLGVLGTCLYADFCWIFFRVTDLHTIVRLLQRIAAWSDGVAFYSSWTLTAMAAVVLATVAAVIKSRREQKNHTEIEGFYVIGDLGRTTHLIVFFVVIGMVLGLAYAYSNPFIYANF